MRRRITNVKGHRELIIKDYQRGILVSVIARREKVSQVTIYKYLLLWNAREKREKVTSEGNKIRRKSTIIVPLAKRISPELLAKMKYNTSVNKKCITRYLLKDDICIYRKEGRLIE
jgi:hypothetical protein